MYRRDQLEREAGNTAPEKAHILGSRRVRFKKGERWRRNKPNDTMPRGGDEGGKKKKNTEEENGREVGKRTTLGEPQV